MTHPPLPYSGFLPPSPFPPSGINSAGLRLKPAPNTSPCSSYNQTKKKNADLIRRLRANMERGKKRKRLTPDNSANTTHINAAE